MTAKHKCPIPGCKKANHDLCLCGHDRMDHDPTGACWGYGVDGCYPACEEFMAATEDQVAYYFKHFMKMVERLKVTTK